MPETLHPGVYVLEIPSGVRPIEGVGTSTAAFVGMTDKGPLPGTILPNVKAARPLLVTSFTDYVRQFGGFRVDSFLTYAVQSACGLNVRDACRTEHGFLNLADARRNVEAWRGRAFASHVHEATSRCCL